MAGKPEARVPGAIGIPEKAGWKFYLVLIALLLEFGRPQDVIPGLKVVPLPSMVDLLIGLNVFFSGKISLATTQTKLWVGLLSLMALHVPFATNNFWALMVFKDMVLYFFLYLGITAYIDSIEKMRKLVTVWVGIHLVLAILGMQSEGKGVGGWLGDENDFCMEMNVAVPFAYFMLLGLKHRPSRVFYFSLLCIFIMTAMVTLSRGGFIGLAAVGTYCWLKSSQKGRAVVLGGVVIILMLIFAPEKYWEEVQSSTSDQTMTVGTGAERLYTWGIGWQMFLGNPIFGVGQGNFPWNFDEFQGAERFNTRSLSGRAAHSMYFTLLPELGLIGTGMFFMMMLSNYTTAGRVRLGAKRMTIAVPKDGKKENDIAFSVALSSALEAAMVGYLVSSVFIATLYYPTIWILTGFAVALGNVTTREFAQGVSKMPSSRSSRFRPVHSPQSQDSPAPSKLSHGLSLVPLNPMKRTVLFFSTSSGPGGAERVVSNLAAALDPDSFRPLVCLFRPGWLKEQCEYAGIPTYVIPNKGVLDFSWIRRFLRLLKEERVAIIHAHEFDAIVHGTMAACFARTPVVATIHGKHYFWEKRSRRLAYQLVSRYAKMVVVSEDLKGFVIKRAGIPKERLTVIYNGIAHQPAVKSPDLQQCRDELGLNEDDQVVGTVGSLYPVKGHKYLLEAVPCIIKKCPQVKFLIIGRGDQETVLTEQVKRLGIGNYVRFLGLRQDIPRLLSVMNVFVLPSLSEGLSIAALEAMASGRPIVATRVGGNPELVIEGETGLLVPSEDSHALGIEIVRILNDRALAGKLGENALRRAQERFDIKIMAHNYQELYRSCLEDH